MPFADNSAWVTGMAWNTSLGNALPLVWDRLMHGATGIVETPSVLPLRSPLAAPIPDFATNRTSAERQILLASETASQALENAGLAVDDPCIQPIFGTSYGAHLDDIETQSLSRWSEQTARNLGLPTTPITVSTACSAGADALFTGLMLLRQGIVDICLCGGADVLTPGKRLGHSVLGTMSSEGLYAFDARRSGTVLGEGAAFIVLESARSARARGATPRGILSGAGAANDAASATAPDPSGRNVILTMERALRSAGLSADAIGLINAHGSGTPVNDDVEMRAYNGFFADTANKPHIFATKGAFGHTLGATGAIEAVATLLALETGQVPPVCGLQTPLPDLTLPVSGTPVACPAGAGMSITLGFGGFNTCLVLQSRKEATI